MWQQMTTKTYWMWAENRTAFINISEALAFEIRHNSIKGSGGNSNTVFEVYAVLPASLEYKIKTCSEIKEAQTFIDNILK